VLLVATGETEVGGGTTTTVEVGVDTTTGVVTATGVEVWVRPGQLVTEAAHEIIVTSSVV